MSGSKVKRLRRDMKQRGYDQNRPIDVADVDGRLIILDGHHRAKAAAQAGVGQVPVRVYNPTAEQASLLLQQAAEASVFVP